MSRRRQEPEGRNTRDVRYARLAERLEREPEPRPVNVCIATPEVIGPYKCGGIGTLYTTLAESLAAAGHAVTILYLRGTYCENGALDDWTGHYASKGIDLVPLPGESLVPARGALGAVTSYRTYLWLREHAFDVVHVSELGGAGYYSMLAKQQGTDFANTLFVVGTHGPTLWVREANAEPLHDLYDLENDFTERKSVALADYVWSPSRYLFGWMERNGFELPDVRYVQPYILPQAARPTAEEAFEATRAVREIVFFGRLETRKGLELFCDAIDELHSMGHEDLAVSFLGRNWRVGGEDSLDYIRARAERWPFSPRVVSDLSQPEAIAFLREDGRLAVIPSFMDNSPNTVYECLGAGVPFLASDSGGIPELIHDDDRSAVCFRREPVALAERLEDVLRDGHRASRPAVGFETNERQWIAWHETVPRSSRAATSRLPAGRWPRVSVCRAVTSAGPDKRSRESLRALDYPDLELLSLRCDGPEDVADTWNRASRRADGDYLLLLDERHEPRPEALARLVRTAEQLGAAVVTSFVTHVDARGDEERPTPVAIELPLGASASVGGYYNCFGTGPLLVRADTLASLGGVKSGVRGSRDFGWSLWLGAALHGLRCEVVPSPLFLRPSDSAASDDVAAAADDPYPDHVATMEVLGDAFGPALRALALAGPALRDRAQRETRPSRAASDRAALEQPAETLSNAGRILADGGLTGAAVSLLEHARRRAGSSGRPSDLVRVELVDAYARARAGARDEARERALRAVADADRTGNALLRFEATLRSAEIASIVRDVDTAKGLYLDAVKLARGLNRPQAMIEALTSAGTAHAALDELELARQMWTTAFRLAQQNRFPRALERTRELLSSLSRAG